MINECIYLCDDEFDSSPPINEIDLNKINNLSYNIVYRYLYTDIHNILNKTTNHGDISIKRKTAESLVNQLISAHSITLKDKTKLEMNMFILYEICNSLYRMNDEYFNVSYESYRTKVLFPCVIYILFRHLPSARSYLNYKIKYIYNNILNKNYGTVKKFIDSYFHDEYSIRYDILYSFIGNGLLSCHPTKVEHYDKYYNSIFKNIFYYYFKSKDNRYQSMFYSIADMDSFALNNTQSISQRESIYRDVLYSVQVQKYCDNSPIIAHVNYNYNIFKNIIVNNEIQNMYFSNEVDLFLTDDSQYKLIEIINQTEQLSNEKIKRISNLSLINKLLKSVHIINSSSKPYNEMVIKPNQVKNAVMLEISLLFKNIFSDSHISPIIEKTAENFVSNLLSGEYINLITLESIKINSLSFISQLREFIKICIEDIDLDIKGDDG